MRAKSRMMTMFLAMVTAAGVAACGADDKGEKAATPATNKEGAQGPNPVVEMKTSMGTIKIELDRKNSPLTVENFLKYVENKHYDNTIFHRVMETFMIQGGGFEKGDTPTEKETLPPVRNEAKTNGLHNEKYTIAMARTNAPHSATSQFFINVVDNRRGLDAGGFSPDGYAVFGKVIEGTETVDKIKMVKTATKQLKSRSGPQTRVDSHENVPVEQVVIESVRVVEKKAEAKSDKNEDKKSAE